MWRAILAIALIIGTTADDASADRRKYAFTYQYGTIAPEHTELELYQTTKLAAVDNWEYRIEIEHGLTPNWDISVYQIFAQREGESFKWDAFQLRTRFRLSQPDRFPLDPLLYIEYNRKVDLKKQNKLETKLILSRDFDRLNLSLNPVYELFWAPGDPKHEIGLDAGLSWEFAYQFAAGVESVTRAEFEDGASETASYFGPAMSYSSGEVYYTVSALWGLTDDSDDARVRFLMGIGL